MLTVSGIDKKDENVRKIIHIMQEKNCPLYIWGNGVYAAIIVDYLLKNHVDDRIVYVIDDAFYNDEKKREGKITFSEYVNKFASCAPLVCGIYNYGVFLDRKENFGDRMPFFYDFHFAVVNNANIGWEYESVIEKINQYNETYELLSDERSKLLMEAYINAAVAGEFDHLFKNYRDEVPYFQRYLSGKKITKLFDCGAYDGDSAHDFINAFPEYDAIFEFEPDCMNVEKIKQRIKDETIINIAVIEKGVWSETKTLTFASEGKSSSIISDEGDDSIDVIKLDDMYEEFTKTSLIKMDIEGSELEALKGTAKVISEISPYLAICVYHKTDELISIPQYIDSLVAPGTYHYYLGYQGSDLAELVFYAVRV